MMRLLYLLFFLTSSVYAGDSTPSLLNGLVGLSNPGMRLIKTSEIDKQSCGKDAKSWIQGDFNGDGTRDYAGLFITPKLKEGSWNGYKYKFYEGSLIAFFGQKDGTFKSVVVQGAGGPIPFIEALYLQPSGPIQGIGDSAGLTLSYEAIGHVNCEKSSSVFYWRDGAFREFWTSD